MLKQSTETHFDRQRENRYRLFNTIRHSALFYYISIFFIGFFVAGASYFDSCVFCGVAFVGALGSGIRSVFGLAGVFAGYLWFFGFDQSVLYLGASLFVYTISFIFQYTPMSRSGIFMPLVVSLIIGLIRAYGTINIIRGNMGLIGNYCFEALGTGLLTYLYSLSLRRNELNPPKNLSTYSCYALLAAILTRFSDLYFLTEISPAVIVAMALLLSVMRRGEIQVYPISIMLGFSLQYGNTARAGAFLVFQLYALADVTPLKKSKLLLSTYVLAVYFVQAISCGLPSVFVWQLSEILMAILLFLCLPRDRVLERIKSKHVDIHNQYQENTMYISRLSELINDMSSFFPEYTEFLCSKPDLLYVFERALDKVCGSCEKRKFCREKHYYDLAFLQKKTEKQIFERGRLELDDLTNEFRKNCIQGYSVVLAINYELQRWNLSARLSETEHTNVNYCKQQYELFSRTLNAMSDHLKEISRDSVAYTPRYSAEVGFASKRKYGEGVCGDTVKFFKTHNEMLYVILSDGMGSGEDAEKISSYTVSFIERGLKLLSDPITVVELVHSILRSIDQWTTTTIDLLSVNLYTGELTFYKLGACDSYILSSDNSITVKGNVYSAGNTLVNGIPINKYQIPSEAIIVLASDGTALDKHHPALQTLWKNRDNMKYAARQLLLSAEDELSDDKTVITVWIKKKLDSV